MRYHNEDEWPPTSQGMSNGTLHRVCVRPEQGNTEEDNPMSESSSSSAKALKTPKTTKTQKIKKGSFSKNDPGSDSNSPKKIVPPRFNANGKCNRCLSIDLVHEMITCNICDDSFHALCRDRRNISCADSICTKTFLNEARPVIAKHGANSNRWGNFMFVCNRCVKSVKSLKTSNIKLASKHVQTDCTNINVELLNDENAIPESESSQQSNDQLHAPSLLKNIGALMSEMKKDILKNVHDLMDEKLSHHEATMQDMNCASSSTKLLPNLSDVSSLTSFDQVAEDSQSMNNMPMLYSDALGKASPQHMQALSLRPRQPSTISQVSSNFIQNIDGDGKSDEQVVVLSTNQEEGHNLDDLKDLTGSQLKDIPVNFLRCNIKTRKIIIGFPSKKASKEGKEILSKCEALKSVDVSDAKKMMPKITVTNVPNYVISHITAERDKLPIDDYRARLKEHLYSKILEKNHSIKELVSSSGDVTFSIVYVNVGKEYSTLGIKVSPIVWRLITSSGSLFIGNSKCPVADRFDIKQCFKCQKLGHIAKTCPQDGITCMYCGASHMTSQCPHKKDCSQYRCTNCSHSKNPSINQSCSTHHSGSDLCPVIVNERKRLQLRTEYSKNM